MTDHRPDNTERDSGHDNKRLTEGLEGDGQQGIDTEEGNRKAGLDVTEGFRLLFAFALKGVPQTGIQIFEPGQKAVC